jgi:ribosome recycling factor
MSDAENIIKKHNEECLAAIQAFKRDLQKVRTGRASAALLEGIAVDYYGAKTHLEHLGQISTPEARLIVIQVYDASAVQAVEKAIMSANLGLNPSREGNTIRVSVPVLTQDARKNIVRALHKQAEDMRVSVRNRRRDANDELKELEKSGELTKDDSKKSMDRIQKQTDSAIVEIDKLLAAKEAECMEV